MRFGNISVGMFPQKSIYTSLSLFSIRIIPIGIIHHLGEKKMASPNQNIRQNLLVLSILVSELLNSFQDHNRGFGLYFEAYLAVAGNLPRSILA